MDLVSEISNNISNQNFDKFTIIRYIYLYLCQTFSYDSRFFNKNNAKLRAEIYNKKIDIRNVNDFEIVCDTFSNILVDILKVYDIDAEIKFEQTDSKYKHTYVVVELDEYKLKLDTTKKYDTARVKLLLPTLGFIDLNNNPGFKYDMALADAKIGLVDKKLLNYNFYNNSYKEIRDVFNKMAISMNLTGLTLFEKKLEEVCSSVAHMNVLTHHNDMNYYVSYLLELYQLKEDHAFVRGSIFFNKEDSSDIIDIFYVDYRNVKECFYILKKENDNYHINEIDAKEVLDLLESYEGLNDYYYVQVAEKIKREKERNI